MTQKPQERLVCGDAHHPYSHDYGYKPKLVQPNVATKPHLKPKKKHPGDPLVFDYRALPYAKYAGIQIVFFLLVVPAVLVYYRFYSKWRGPMGFFHHIEAWGPVVGFLAFFLLLTLYAPIRDLLTIRNERIEIHGDRLHFYTMWNRKKVDAKLSEIKLLRAGIALTSKVRRYVFTAGKASFFFSADIGDAKRLLKLLNVNE